MATRGLSTEPACPYEMWRAHVKAQLHSIWKPVFIKQHFLSHPRLPVEVAVTLGGGPGTHDARYGGRVASSVAFLGWVAACVMSVVFRFVSGGFSALPFHNVCARPQNAGAPSLHTPCSHRCYSICDDLRAHDDRLWLPSPSPLVGRDVSGRICGTTHCVPTARGTATGCTGHTGQRVRLASLWEQHRP